MDTHKIANRLVELCRQGNWDAAQQELYAENCVSLEPAGAPNERAEGMDAIREKGKRFNEMVEAYHGNEVSDPLVADNYISCWMKLNMTMKGAPGPSEMEELCVYEVKDGKIVKEQFFYTPEPMP